MGPESCSFLTAFSKAAAFTTRPRSVCDWPSTGVLLAIRLPMPHASSCRALISSLLPPQSPGGKEVYLSPLFRRPPYRRKRPPLGLPGALAEHAHCRAFRGSESKSSSRLFADRRAAGAAFQFRMKFTLKCNQLYGAAPARPKRG